MPAHCSRGRLHVTLPDPGRRWDGVRLACDADLAAIAGLAEADLELAYRAGAWRLDLPVPPLARLEYRFAVLDADGDEELVCDPGGGGRVGTAFGDRSVVEMPGYRAPWWLAAPTAPGRLDPVEEVAGDTSAPVPTTLWQPADAAPGEALPLLVVHDGPEYDERASLTRYSAAMIAAGRLPRHRVALLHPGDRDAWYSASRAYARSLTGPVLASLRERVAVDADPVVMGASLGGLVSLTSALFHPGSFAGVFSQSGSFFSPHLDAQESGYRYFWRIADAVHDLHHGSRTDRSLRVGLTCGALEENAANNRRMAAALRRDGHRVSYAEVADVHSYTAWRDALDPHLTAVLLDLWGDGQPHDMSTAPAAAPRRA